MTQVTFTFDALADVRPGVALVSVWPAFTAQAFKKIRFDMPYASGFNRGAGQELTTGSYWVKVKFPSGAQAQKLFEVPPGTDHHEVSLGANGELISESDRFLNSDISSVDIEFAVDSSAPHLSLDYLVSEAPGELPVLGRPGTLDLPAAPGSAPESAPLVSSPPTKTLGGPSSGIRSRGTPMSGATSSVHPVSLPPRAGTPIVNITDYSVRILETAHANWPVFDSASIRGYFSSIRLRVPGFPVHLDVANNALRAQLPDSFSPHDWARRYVEVRGALEGGRTLISVPAGNGTPTVRLTLTAPKDGYAMGPGVAIEVGNPKYNSLLRFLRQNDLRSAVQILASAQELLHAKFDDPVAAAAAGYVLLNAPPTTMRVPWDYWIGNLGAYFSHIPDGRILHATLLLQRSDVYAPSNFGRNEGYFPSAPTERLLSAARHIRNALQKGPPMFRMGLNLLASNIAILLDSDLPKNEHSELRRADRLVTALRRRVDTVEPFCVFRLEAEDV